LVTDLNEKSQSITLLLNGTLSSMKNLVPLAQEFSKPILLKDNLSFQFGVLIGITGGIKGQLVFTGDPKVFGALGESLFGMQLEGEMLKSFSGEFGNMIAGGLATKIIESRIKVDITTPTVLTGDTTLSGYKRAVHMSVFYTSVGDLNIYFLLEQ
jgi:chemotaxis protein CheX